MGFFEDAFDIKRDGKVSIGEELIAFTMLSALSGKQRDDSEIETNESDGDDDSDPITPITVVLKKDAEDIEMDLEELRNNLYELEGAEPDDSLRVRHERWESNCDIVREAISDLESKIQDRIETIQEKLDELECDEPEDCTGSAYDHWEERCEELQEQIDELEALL